MSGAWPGADVSRLRRIVVGQDAEGRSAVTFDDASPEVAVNPVYAGVQRASLWREPQLVDFASAVDGIEAYPATPVGGSFFYIVEIAPRTEIPLHTTPTIEYHCVVAGRITCVLEDGEVEAGAGDVLIMRGVPHGWSNRTDERWLSVATMIDHRDSPGAAGRPVG